MSAEECQSTERALRRIDELTAGLDRLADPAAREMARALLEAVLDLHGLALARIMALAAAADGGAALLGRFAQDEPVRAALLLYGLHPEDTETRVRRALAALGSRLGIGIELARIHAGAAYLRTGGAAADAESLRREIEEAIVNAAPELDGTVLQGLDETGSAAAAALAG